MTTFYTLTITMLLFLTGCTSNPEENIDDSCSSVTIESKFVEISPKDIEELGFDWKLLDTKKKNNALQNQ